MILENTVQDAYSSHQKNIMLDGVSAQDICGC